MTNFSTSSLKYYSDNAADFVNQTLNVDMQDLYNAFIKSLLTIQDQHILDLGCGSGRDANYFANQGFKVTAIDGSSEIIDVAKEVYCQSNISWQCCTFDEVAHTYQRQSFTGIWACASLLHVPYEELPFLLEKLILLLKKNGIFYASFKHGDSERIENGRFFCDMNEVRWKSILSKLNDKFNYKVWITSDNRSDNATEWFNTLVLTFK